MPMTIPALRGKFGTTEYWLTTMRVGELVSKIQMPADMPGWESLSLDDVYQRKIDIARITKQIAPYFAMNQDRFTGALVLAIINGEDVEFEPLGEFSGGGRVPQLYRSASQDIGFLTLNGQEMFIPIDGQHRAKAFRFAMNGTDDKGQPIAGMRSNPALAEDQSPIILFRFDTRISRRIFNRINRYAKPVTDGDGGIATDDEDAIAILTRNLVREDSESDIPAILPVRLIRLGGNTLMKKSPEFMPLLTFYQANRVIAEEAPGAWRDPSQMDEEQRELVEEEVRRVWETLFTSIDLFAVALRDPGPNGDTERQRIREQTLLGKPVAQLALLQAFLYIRKNLQVSDKGICDRLNLIDWRVDANMWRDVLIAPNGRVMSGKTVARRASRFIAHLVGVQLPAHEVDALREGIYGEGWEDKELPPPVA